MRMSFFCCLLVAGVATSAEPLKPGLAVGQRPGPYSFLVATGPQRGQSTCYVCEQANKPTAIVFARQLTPALGQLLLTLDAESPKRKESGYKAWMTLLADQADLNELGKWATRQGLKTLPVGVFEDVEGPPAYKVASPADVVLIFSRDQKVQRTWAWRSGELDEKALKQVSVALPDLFKK